MIPGRLFTRILTFCSAATFESFYSDRIFGSSIFRFLNILSTQSKFLNKRLHRADTYFYSFLSKLFVIQSPGALLFQQMCLGLVFPHNYPGLLSKSLQWSTMNNCFVLIAINVLLQSDPFCQYDCTYVHIYVCMYSY